MTLTVQEARSIIKNAKMLIHYYHHFGECKNLMFVVQGKPAPFMGQPQNWNKPAEYEKVTCLIYPAKDSYYNPKTKETKKLYSDGDKLLNYIKFNPDINIDNIKITNNSQISFDIVSVNPELTSIRSDFFK